MTSARVESSLLTLIFASHFTTSLHPIHLFGLNLQAYDFMIFIWLVYSAVIYGKYRLAVPQMTLLVFLVFGVWAFAMSLSNPSPAALSLLIQLIRSVVVGILMVQFSQTYGFEPLFKSIDISLKLAIVITLLSLTLSVVGIFDGAFERGNAGSMRFEGFANDSNFLGMMILLLICLSYRRVGSIWTISGLALCVLTMSRTVFIGIAFIGIVKSAQLAAKNWRVIVFAAFIIFPIIGILAALYSQDFSISANTPEILQIMQERFSRLGNRVIIWAALINDLLETGQIWGNGLRSTEGVVSEVSRNRYSHNTFIDILYEYGLLPLVYLVFLYLSLLLHQIQLDRQMMLVTGLQILMFMTLSVFYLPFTMMILAVLLARKESFRVEKPLFNISR